MKIQPLYRPLTIVLPIAAALCASGVSAYEWRRLKQFESEVESTQSKLTQIDRELRSYEAQPQTQKYPTVPKTSREQALFLNAMRSNADASKVQLIRWSNLAPPATAQPTQPSPEKDKAAAGPAGGVTPIISVVEVSGRSENTRVFLYNVMRSRRLYNMTDIKWVRDTWPNTHLTFTLTRYVAPPLPLPIGTVARSPGSGASHTATEQSNSTVVTPVGGTVGSDGTQKSLSLPNPMDAPGIAHGPYQSQLDAKVSQLKDMDRSQQSESQHSPGTTNAKH